MRAIATITLVFVIAWVPVTFAQATDEAVLEVVVRNPDLRQFYRRGTAFHVGGGLFYTNAHVVRTKVPDGFSQWYLAGTAAARSVDTWVGPASVTCVHTRWREAREGQSSPFDVAHLTALPAWPPVALTLDTRNPISGMRVVIKGFASASFGWPPKLYTATGRVARVWSFEHVFSIDIDSGFAMQGSSGSPVFTEAGQVIGMVYAGNHRQNRDAASQSLAVTVVALNGCPVPP